MQRKHKVQLFDHRPKKYRRLEGAQGATSSNASSTSPECSWEEGRLFYLLEMVGNKIAKHLTIKDMCMLASTNKLHQGLCDEDFFWRKRYRNEFGALYFNEDYKAQYKAYFLWFKFADELQPSKRCRYIEQLKSILTPFEHKAWTLFFKGGIADYLSEQERLWLKGHRAGDLKCTAMLLDLIHKQPQAGAQEKILKILNFIELSSSHILQRNQLRCLIFALLSRETYADHEAHFGKAQELFFNCIKPHSKDVIGTLHFITCFIEYRRELTFLDTQKFTNFIRTVKEDTVLFAIANYLKLPGRHSRITRYFNDLLHYWADKGEAKAAYLYAESKRHQIFHLLSTSSPSNWDMAELIEAEARKYYLLAIRGKAFEAVAGETNCGGLLALYRHFNQQEAIHSPSFVNLMKEATRAGNVPACLALASYIRTQKNWHHDLENIVWLQWAASIKKAFYQDQVIKVRGCMESQLLKAGGYHCYVALGLIYATALEDKQQAYHYFDAANARDPSLFERYMAALQFQSLDTHAFEQTLTTYRADRATCDTTRYALRSRR